MKCQEKSTKNSNDKSLKLQQLFRIVMMMIEIIDNICDWDATTTMNVYVEV